MLTVLRGYHPGLILVCHIPTNGDDKTYQTFVSRRCQIPHIRGVIELNKVPLLATKSLANSNQFPVHTDRIGGGGEPKGLSLRTVRPEELDLLTIQLWKPLCPASALFTSIAQPPATGKKDTSNAIAVEKLSVESTRQTELLFHAVESQKGLRINPHKVPVPVPHRIRHLGVYYVEERAKPVRLRNEMGWGFSCL